MHIEVGIYEGFVLATILLVYCWRYLHDAQGYARPYHENGPWSPFEDLKEQQPLPSQTSESSTAATSSAFSSPSESPIPSQDSRASVVSSAEMSTSSHNLHPGSFSTHPSSQSSLVLEEATVSTFADRILTNDLLYDLILWFSDPSVLLRLARVCRISNALVRSHIARCFDINKHLSHFFASPLEFRALQARTGALISGSNALQFFDRKHYSEADLDIYCTYDVRHVVGWWLIEHEGYTFKPHTRQDASFAVALDQARPPGTPPAHPYSRLKAVSAVYTFTKRVQDLDGPSRRLKVQIIVAYTSPMEAIFDFHSTAVLNVISYSHAYSLYPRATFHHRIALALTPSRRLDSTVVAKYEARGYTFVHTVPTPLPATSDSDDDAHELVLRLTRPRECDHCAHCIARRAHEESIARSFPLDPRWIGDRHSWVLPLRMDGVLLPATLSDGVSPALPRDPCAVTTWEMGLRDQSRGMAGRRIHARVRRPEGFRHYYVVCDWQVKKAMRLVQELYLDIPAEGGVDVADCDEEFMRWCVRMLEEEQMWERWYPPGDVGPTIEF